MDKFLIELLLKNNSVILPDFGAIVIANEHTGDVMFNEYLKFNDGKLIALIVANSSMSEQDATNMVAKYIREIQIQLDKGESYDIFGLGSFLKDKDGSTLFKGNVNSSNIKEPEMIAGPSPTPMKEVTEKKEELPIEDEKKDEDRPEIDLTVSLPDEIVEKEIERTVVKAEADKSKKEGEKSDKPKKVKPPKEKKEKKKRGIFFWFLIFLLIIVTGGGVFVGLNYDEVKAYMGWDKFNTIATVAELDETMIEKDVTPEDIATEEEQFEEEAGFEEADIIEEEVAEEIQEVAKSPKEKPVVTVSTDGKPFHLIGGSFSEASNAENFVSELKSKGFPAHVVGYFNGLHMVSVKSFASRAEAMAEISAIQNEASGAWLFKYPK